MSPVPQYMRWLSILSAVMASFGVGVLVIGYKTPSVGRIMTIVFLYIVAIALFYGARYMIQKNHNFTRSLSSETLSMAARTKTPASHGGEREDSKQANATRSDAGADAYKDASTQQSSGTL